VPSCSACANVSNLLLGRADVRHKKSRCGSRSGPIARRLTTNCWSKCDAFVGWSAFGSPSWPTPGLRCSPVFIPPASAHADMIVDQTGKVLVSPANGALDGPIFGLAPASQASISTERDSLSKAAAIPADACAGKRCAARSGRGSCGLGVLLIGAGLLITSFMHLRKSRPRLPRRSPLALTVHLSE